VFRRQRVVVFVDGCFWHGCPQCYRRPATHRGYWDAKVRLNKRRDRLVRHALRRAGWRVLRVWEHELARKRETRLVRRIQPALSLDCVTPHRVWRDLGGGLPGTAPGSAWSPVPDRRLQMAEA
jgi:DNA mismatch endonuclease (patch repair protein)